MTTIGRALAACVVGLALAGCGSAAGSSGSTTAATGGLYGEEDGLECHERADGEELVESAVYDYAEDAGFESSLEAAVGIATAEQSALQRPGLEQEVDGSTVSFVDDHGHVQAVLTLRRRGGGFRVEDTTACSPG